VLELQELADKAMPRVRSKSVYRLLLERAG